MLMLMLMLMLRPPDLQQSLSLQTGLCVVATAEPILLSAVQTKQCCLPYQKRNFRQCCLAAAADQHYHDSGCTSAGGADVMYLKHRFFAQNNASLH